MNRTRTFRAGLAAVALAAGLLWAFTAQTAPAQDVGAPADQTAVLKHLNAVVTWYRQLISANESAGQPSDTYYLDNSRSLAKQVVELAFESAEAEADILSAGTGKGLPSTEQQNLKKAGADAAARSKQTQEQLDALDAQLQQATGKKRQGLAAQRDALQGQLDFDKALQDGVQKLSAFATGNARNAGGLQKQIEDLKASVPDVFAKPPAKGGVTPSATAASTPPPAPPSGLISQTISLFSSFGDLREIDQLVRGAGTVSAMASELHTPLRDSLRAAIAQGRQLADPTAQPDPATLEQDRQKLSGLTAQFKLIANAAIPLSQEIVLLGEIQANLQQWEISVHRGYVHLLESVVVHIAALLIGVLIVLGLSEIWRKAALRYVRDPRLRHQLLLLRRFVTGVLLAMVLLMGFVSEFGSLATFAGFLTAGIAVALQTIILSVAAYFFLLGRHGIRVGDRISVSGVTGDVVDVGMVRLSLMELGGTGADVHPTGRMVMVSNSVLFQGALFKQIPGTAYSWHELALRLPSGGDYAAAESKMLEAVNSIYGTYRDSLEQQQQVLEGIMAIPITVPTPQTSLQLAETGIDLIVRYPVVLHRETEIDNQMAKKVVEVINADPALKAAVGSTTIRPSFKQ